MTTPDQVLAEARKELGYTESPRGSNRQKFAAEAGHANGHAWCRTFTVAIAKRAGLTVPYPESAYTPTAANAYKQLGRFDLRPQVGDEVFFDFPDSKTRIQHVGFLEKWGEGAWGPWVQTIDGNTSSDGSNEDNGGGVFRRSRPLRYVVGFGHPAYEEDDMFEDKDRAAMTKIAGQMAEVVTLLKEVVDAVNVGGTTAAGTNLDVYLKGELGEIKRAIATLQTGSGDPEAFSDAVADKLAERLKA